MAADASATASSATSNTSSSCTCMIIRTSSSRPRVQSCRDTMARLMTSAAVPCIGALIAVRSAYWRRAAFRDLISGRCSRRPNTVST